MLYVIDNEELSVAQILIKKILADSISGIGSVDNVLFFLY